jgi:hypothetical protein
VPARALPERNGQSDRSRSRARSWRLAGARRPPDRARPGSGWPGTALRPRQGGAGRRPRPRRGSRRPRPSGPRRPPAPSRCRRARARTGIRARRALRGGARRARAGFGRPRPLAASRRGLPRAQAQRAPARPGPRTGPSPARAPLQVPRGLLQRPAVPPAEPLLGWARSRSRPDRRTRTRSAVRPFAVSAEGLASCSRLARVAEVLAPPRPARALRRRRPAPPRQPGTRIRSHRQRRRWGC